MTTEYYPDSYDSSISSAAYFAMWQQGHISSQEALSSMCADLHLLDNALALMTEQRNALRAHIEIIAAQSGGTTARAGASYLERTESQSPAWKDMLP